MRKLASIRRIDAIRPIPGADAIECAQVGGWTVVVKRGEYTAGDLAVYCEIDSWIPNSLAPFLSRGQPPREYDGIPGERLRSVRLRGQLSQGLLLPLDPTCNAIVSELFEGLDVSVPLGIVKWEAPIPAQLAGEVRGAFPGFIPKTDQERVQNLSAELADWRQRQLCWEVTEKLDGSSMTVYYRDGEVGVCSRNLELRDTESNTLWQVAHREGIVSCLLDLRFNVAVQGELIGEGIQGNPYRLRGQSFRVFDVYLIDQGRYMLPQERQDWCELNELQTVPVLMHTLTDTGTTVEGLLVSAEGASELNERAEREGLVFKCMSENLSFKAISNRFLLKGGN